MKAQLRKVKWNKGTVEGSGQEYDYTRVYVEIPVYEQQQKEFGVDVLELEYGTEADHIKLAHLQRQTPPTRRSGIHARQKRQRQWST